MAAARRTGRIFLLSLICVGILSAMPVTIASAHTGRQIEVYPGPHALAKALAEAKSGDVLAMHTGRYRDSVIVTMSNIVIEAAGDGPVTIDGRCSAWSTIAVRADAVTIEGRITVVGGQFYAVDFQHVLSGIVNGLTVKDTCGALYGINLYDTGPISVSSNTASGFSDAGIYVGNITDTDGSRIMVASNEVFGNERGIIVEDAFGVSIEVAYNNVHDNSTSGIHLSYSDGILVDHNTVRNDGTYGIDLDENSDQNRVVRNTAHGHQFDLANLGGNGNCFKRNRYKTHFGDVGC